MRRDALEWEELLCNEERCPGMRIQGDLVPLSALASQKCRAALPWVSGWSPCPVPCSHPALPVVTARMPNALERTQGLVTKSAGALPRVCQLRSAFRLLSLLFVFSSAPNSPSLRCRPARRGTNKGVVMAEPWKGWGDSPGPLTPPRALGKGRD